MEKIATREAYGIKLAEIGEKYTDIVVLDADLSKATKTEVFRKKYPNRFFNMGIAEADMVGTAAGLATCGKIPFLSTFAIFASTRSLDQIRNSVAYPNLNVKICATHAGITVGEDGGSHQAIEDLAIMRSIPNMTVISTCDATSTNWAVEEIAKYKGPVYLRLGRVAVPTIYEQANFQIGKGVTLKEGNDVTIIATGVMVHEALAAYDKLKEKGINARVIDMHTIKPIDKDLIIRAAKETKLIVTCEEHNIYGGLGSAVCEVVCENHPITVRRVGVNDVFGRSGNSTELMKIYNLTSDDIVKSVIDAL